MPAMAVSVNAKWNFCTPKFIMAIMLAKLPSIMWLMQISATLKPNKVVNFDPSVESREK